MRRPGEGRRRGSIDRRAWVGRHDPRVTGVLARWPLQVGNGSLAFGVDVTGLQTYPDAYPQRYDGAAGTLLGTMSQWAWHTEPAPRPYLLAETERCYDTPRGPRPYVDLRGDSAMEGGTPGSDAEEWLRGNPHRLQLARIGFDTAVDVAELSGIDQRLDLWSGAITSRFVAPGGRDAEVLTAVHGSRDAIGIVSDAGWPVLIEFPYGSTNWALAGDWGRPDAHATRLEGAGEGGPWRITRTLDADRYVVDLRTNGTVEAAGTHGVRVRPPGRGRLELSVLFTPAGADDVPDAADVLRTSASAWCSYWTSGAAVEFDGAGDPRAAELERRVVLSCYVTRVNCAASTPVAESGLLCNSWRGKMHLEMHWWHMAHFASWGRPELVEPSLDWYATIMPGAQATARRQGYAGARWPKQVGPEGRESPSGIGTFLVWQQPHPIHLAELVVRAHRHLGRAGRADELQRRWAPIVAQTATLMADLAEPHPDGGFTLGPPLVPAQESYGRIRHRVTGPTFELAYWCWVLMIARRWQDDLGLPSEPASAWERVAAGLVRPHVRDGVYAAIDVEPFTIRTDHPSMLAAFGLLPATSLIDPETMRATLADVLDDWDWDSTWGWDYPMAAMTAARLGDAETAVDVLLMDVPKNEHGPNGHNRQAERLPAYLPGNGGLLAAVALMVAGWDGGPPHPGIPAGWTVRSEGFVPAPG